MKGIIGNNAICLEKLEKKMSGNKCAYYNCGLSARNNPSLRLSHFPVKDTARCKRWILHSVCIPEKNTRGVIERLRHWLLNHMPNDVSFF
ncbi:hypothetical protein JTB14_004842 [Gonioctena quinquepunctata]|nr:hypothetical protein JTB14_004842 [Gonioctena quinquepunctata]